MRCTTNSTPAFAAPPSTGKISRIPGCPAVSWIRRMGAVATIPRFSRPPLGRLSDRGLRRGRIPPPLRCLKGLDICYRVILSALPSTTRVPLGSTSRISNPGISVCCAASKLPRCAELMSGAHSTACINGKRRSSFSTR